MYLSEAYNSKAVWHSICCDKEATKTIPASIRDHSSYLPRQIKKKQTSLLSWGDNSSKTIGFGVKLACGLQVCKSKHSRHHITSVAGIPAMQIDRTSFEIVSIPSITWGFSNVFFLGGKRLPEGRKPFTTIHNQEPPLTIDNH